MKKLNFFGKEISLMLVLVLAVAGFATAALVPYLSNEVSGSASVDSPIELVAVDFDYDVSYSGEDGFALLKLTNNANADVVGTPVFTFSEDEAAMTDMDGMDVAVTEDVNYCWHPTSHGDMTGVIDCETDYEVWLANNPDWLDWVANEAYDDAVYPSDSVINFNGDSFDGIGYSNTNELSLGELTIPAGETFYAVVYVSTEAALRPADYEISFMIEA